MSPFHPVLKLPPGAPVYDFSKPEDIRRAEREPYGIGRYDERRTGMYESPLFTSGGRDVHVGIDLFAPVGTPVEAFDDGEVFLFAYNGERLDYGYTLITRHAYEDRELYALFGHLSGRSLEGKLEGAKIARGETIAWVGDRHENGGWTPHLHFQISFERPVKADMPGVVALSDRIEALARYPDPRLVLGPIYPDHPRV
jgi:peptidoglycan LD-endopeptidase LytH